MFGLISDWRWVTVALLILLVERTRGLPSLHGTPVEPISVKAGEEALIVCEVTNTENYTVIWQRLTTGVMTSEILTAGTVRVTSYRRFSVIHEKDSNIWALRIFPVNEFDGGRYICEVNSIPRLHVVRVLTVQASNESSHYFSHTTDNAGCCMQANVPLDCLQFCSLNTVLSRSHPNPWHCMDYLPTITRCLTDGRNHLPCCERQNIPEVCRSVCVGDYDLSTVIQHYSCMNYTVPTLACITEGLEILPGPPQELVVQPISSNELRVSWSPPSQSVPVSNYLINVTKIYSLSPGAQFEVVDNRRGKELTHDEQNGSVVETVSSNDTFHVLKNLDPETVYEIRLTSKNDQGHSLPTYAVRTMTLPLNVSPSKTDSAIVNLTVPDIKKCCEDKGVKMGRCLDNMCDLTKADRIRLTDVMICAPWANVTFECMAGEVDHTPCCKTRNVPEVCLDFCRGKVTKVDYRHFVCLDHMESYGNCLLDHYGVLPSEPQDYTVRLIHSEWALLHWKPPTTLGETVMGYNIHWREIDDQDGEYHAVFGVNSPYLLDGLIPGIQYESYIVATNKYGISKHSTQVVFTTSPVVKTSDTDRQNRWYNETACCVSAGLQDECLPLCSYDVKLTDMYTIGPKCVHQMDILIRCAAAGRDHTPCCKHRSVNWDCMPMCAGTLSANQFNLASTCSYDLGNMLQCMMEGVDLLPGIPQDFHSTALGKNFVKLSWNPASDGADAVNYQVRYSQVQHGIPAHPLVYTESVNCSTNTSLVVRGLQTGSPYSFYVVAGNDHGYSQPSLVLILIPADSETNETEISSALGPPHSLEVIDETATTIAIRWLPPHHLAPDASVMYTVYFLPVSQSGTLLDAGMTQDTMFTSAEIVNLTASTQYAIAVRAQNAMGHSYSVLSEILLAWTEAPTPAFVNPPLIIPAGPIIEGRNITIMCIALGTPAPTVSLYINGEVMSEKIQHHVAHTIASIHHNVTNTACFADNGHGQGAYSALEIHVSFPAIAEALQPDVRVAKGRSIRLQCQVRGFPEPRVMWYQGSNKERLMQRSPKTQMEQTVSAKEKASFTSTLNIMDAREEDSGDYLCVAENQLGSSTSSAKVTVQSSAARNTSLCCEEQKVSSGCMDSCAFDIDIQRALDKPECVQDLNKLMYCAADGRDHRQCCRDKSVPRKCRRWCMGNPVTNAPLCALVAAREIVGCFEQGKSVLPGPPVNVQVKQMKTNMLEIHWEPPEKNPDSVQWYRVFWRPVGSRSLFKNETNKAFMTLDNLEEGKMYEVAIKSGNHYGLSVHTDPVVVSINSPGIRPRALIGETSAGVKAVISLAAIVVVTMLVVISVILYLKRKRQQKQDAGVSFENPAYLKDGNNANQTSSTNAEDGNCIQLPTKNGVNGHGPRINSPPPSTKTVT